jgi:hypothetical protein
MIPPTNKTISRHYNLVISDTDKYMKDYTYILIYQSTYYTYILI